MKTRMKKVIQNDAVMDQRIAATIASARATLMNDTKWREVFSLLQRSPHLATPIRWRFISTDKIYTQKVPPLSSTVHPSLLPDDLPYPGGPYREIDWIEIPFTESGKSNDIDALAAELDVLGQLPITHTSSGLRLSGYTW